MNIRSMIKHVAAIITAVGMLLASMAGAVTALAEDSKPTTAVDGPTKPVRIMDNLYQTRYTGDYKLDDYLSANAGGNDDYLAWLRANLNHGKPIPLSTTQACTTLAVTDTDTGHDLMVRNMDWYPAVPGMMVATAPTDGYRSVGVAPVMTGKANATPTTDELETSANIAPLTTMDGVNEKGLSAAILQIHRWQAPNDGKPSISQLAVVRLLLDKAATVDEAISLLGRYDIAAYGDKYASLGGLHYALADATGAKATIEFDGGKMHVTRPTDTYQTTTNTMTWNHEIESDRRWKKVDTAVREAGGSMDERDAFGLLAATPSHSTSTLQWTVAYDLDAKTGIITTRGRTDQARTLTLDGIQTAASPVTVRYDANGGRGTITDMTGNPGDQIDIPSTGVTRSGYTLAGWNTKADGTGASIPAGSYTIPADATGTITLYAQWQRTNTTPTDPDANGLPDRLVNGSFEYPNDYPSYCLSNVAIHSLSADGRMDCVDWIKKDANGKPDDSKYTQKSFTINGFDQKRFGWRSSQTANSPDGRGSVELRFGVRDKQDAIRPNVPATRRANQYSEIVAEQEGAYIYQDIRTVPGHTYHWNLAHASYTNSKDGLGKEFLNNPDCMSVVIGPAPTAGGTFRGVAQQARRLADGAGNDKAGDTGTSFCSTVDEAAVSRGDLTLDYDTGKPTVKTRNNSWERYADRDGYVATSTVTRFTFKSVKQYSVIHGNLIDDIRFSEDTTVTYHANTGSAADPKWTDTTIAGDYTIVGTTHNRFTRDGYEFQGWSQDPKATAASLRTGDIIDVPQAGADLYAVWKRVKTEPTPVPTLPQTGGMLGLIGGLVAVILLTGAGITWRLRRR